MLKIIFLFLMAGGIPVAIAMAGSSLLYIFWSAATCRRSRWCTA
jgi:hypothetical protein